MREAIGGSWLFGIVALFIVLFSSFLAYSISYTKAFNAKNMIINYIEQHEGFTKEKDSVQYCIDNLDPKKCKSTEAKIYTYLTKSGYNMAKVKKCDDGAEVIDPGGYCIKKTCVYDSSGEVYKSTYKITTYIKISLPVVNIDFNLPISGETKSLYHDSTSCEKANGAIELD